MPTNAELIRNNYDAFGRGEIGVVLATLDSEIEWTEAAAGFPYAGTYTGPDAVLAGVFGCLGTEWDGFDAIPDRIVADGGRWLHRITHARGWVFRPTRHGTWVP